MLKNTPWKNLIAYFIFTSITGLFIFFHFGQNLQTFTSIYPEIYHLVFTLPALLLITSFAKYFIGIELKNTNLIILFWITLNFMSFDETLILTTLILSANIAIKILLKEQIIHSFSIVSLTQFSLLIISIGFLRAVSFGVLDETQTLLTIFISIILTQHLLHILPHDSSFLSIKTIKSFALHLLFTITIFILLGGNTTIFQQSIKFNLYPQIYDRFPEHIGFFFIINSLISNYTGLRLSELIRFRKIINKK